jgi:hypothetical protein
MPLLKQVRSAILASKSPGIRRMPVHIDFIAPVVDADHDLLKALERWVEQGVPPEKIIATHYVGNDPANAV